MLGAARLRNRHLHFFSNMLVIVFGANQLQFSIDIHHFRIQFSLRLLMCEQISAEIYVLAKNIITILIAAMICTRITNACRFFAQIYACVVHKLDAE